MSLAWATCVMCGRENEAPAPTPLNWFCWRCGSRLGAAKVGYRSSPGIVLTSPEASVADAAGGASSEPSFAPLAVYAVTIEQATARAYRPPPFPRRSA